MKILILAAAVALPLTLGACHKHGEPSDNKYSEKNHHSQKVTMGSFVDDFFEKMDIDGNGTITRAERRAAPHQSMLLPFEKIDANQDGLLTLEEYRKVVMELHQKPKGLDV